MNTISDILSHAASCSVPSAVCLFCLNRPSTLPRTDRFLRESSPDPPVIESSSKLEKPSRAAVNSVPARWICDFLIRFWLQKVMAGNVRSLYSSCGYRNLIT